MRVKVSGLAKSFEAMDGRVNALQGVDFEVTPGEFYTLLGPSGCGKSTTLRCIAGLERPDGGEIAIGDNVVASGATFVPPNERPIGMVFQSYAIWPHMSVFKNVAFPLKQARSKLAKSQISERVMEALALVQMEGLADRPAPYLSGGQQQRVALARALVSKPEVLLLDEPLSNLDARLREEMRFELRDMQARLGITSIFVTHDQAEAMTLSDRIIVMRGGHIEQEGRPEDVYQRPRTPFVMDFLGRANHLPARIALDDDGRRIAIVAGGCGVPLLDAAEWDDGAEVLLAFRPEAVRAHAADRDGSWVGVVRSSIYVGGHIEYLVDFEQMTVRASGSPDSRLPVGARALLHVS